MRKKIYPLFIILNVLLAALIFYLINSPKAAAVSPSVTIHGQYQEGVILVKFRPEIKSSINTAEAKINLPSLSYLNTKHELKEIKKLFIGEQHANDELGSIYKLTFDPSKKVEGLLADYRNNPMVLRAEPNYKVKATWTPNDPLYNTNQWNFSAVNAEGAWDYDTNSPLYGGDPDIVVAVIDTGVAYENYGSYVQAPDLAETNFVAGYDFVNSDSHANDDEGHGTHVAGTIAQSTNNSIGVAGVAFNTTIMPVKVLPAVGYGSVSDIEQGIDYAVDHGADIINMSLELIGATSEEMTGSTLEDVIQSAADAGVVLVGAAGNGGEDDIGDPEVSYPAAFNEVIAVGATGYDNTKADYSNYGSALDLVAPGGDGSYWIYQQTCSNSPACNSFGYLGNQGTSMAAPHVAGAAALLLAYGVPASNIQTILQDSATDLGATGYDTTYGYGLLDMAAVFVLVAGDDTAPTNPTITGYDTKDKEVNLTSGERYNYPNPYFEWSGATDAGSGVAGYYVYFGTNASANPKTSGTFITDPHYSVGNISGNEINYYLKIKTKDVAGNTTSVSVSFEYVVDTIAATPAGLVTSSNENGIQLNWTASSDSHFASYNVYRSISSNGSYSKINSTAITVNSYLNTNVTAGSTYYYKLKMVDDLGNTSSYSQSESGTFYKQSDIVIGAGPGGGPQVRVFNPDGSLISQFFAYSSTFRGGVNVAVGDLNNDGENEIITGSGPTGGPQVRVFDLFGNPKFTNGFFAYASTVRNGVYVAVGDLNGDGYGEIVTGTGAGSGPHVRTFNRYGMPVFSPGFFAYGTNVRNGVYVATGDLDGNGRDEIITGTGNGSGPHVRTFNYVGTPVFSPGFFPYAQTFRGGVRVGSGDIDGNRKDEILTAPGIGGGPQVRAFNRFGVPWVTNGFFAYSTDFRGGIFLAGGDTNQDGKDEVIASVGSQGSPLIRVFNGTGSVILEEFYGLAQSFTNGINVASGVMN